jgi:hypothetical protein
LKQRKSKRYGVEVMEITIEIDDDEFNSAVDNMTEAWLDANLESAIDSYRENHDGTYGDQIEEKIRELLEAFTERPGEGCTTATAFERAVGRVLVRMGKFINAEL